MTTRLIDYITKPYFIAQTALMIGMSLAFIGAVGHQAQSPPHITQPRYATVEEKHAWQVRQLSDALDEQQRQGWVNAR